MSITHEKNSEQRAASIKTHDGTKMKKTIMTTAVLSSLFFVPLQANAGIIVTADSTVNTSVIRDLGEVIIPIEDSATYDENIDGVIEALSETEDESASAFATSMLLTNGVFGASSQTSAYEFGISAFSDSTLELSFMITNDTDTVRDYDFNFLIFGGGISASCGRGFNEFDDELEIGSLCPFGQLVGASYEASVKVGDSALWSSQASVGTNEFGEVIVDDSLVGDLVGSRNANGFSWRTQEEPFSVNIGQIAPADSVELIYSIKTFATVGAFDFSIDEFGPEPILFGFPEDDLNTLPGAIDLPLEGVNLDASATFFDPADIDSTFASVTSTEVTAVPVGNLGALFALGLAGLLASARRKA
jgi:hypothetical protein